jgi:hypothetical protein
MNPARAIPSVSVRYAQDGSSTRSNEHGMRPMQERAYQKRGDMWRWPRWRAPMRSSRGISSTS